MTASRHDMVLLSPCIKTSHSYMIQYQRGMIQRGIVLLISCTNGKPWYPDSKLHYIVPRCRAQVSGRGSALHFLLGLIPPLTIWIAEWVIFQYYHFGAQCSGCYRKWFSFLYENLISQWDIITQSQAQTSSCLDSKPRWIGSMSYRTRLEAIYHKMSMK